MKRILFLSLFISSSVALTQILRDRTDTMHVYSLLDGASISFDSVESGYVGGTIIDLGEQGNFIHILISLYDVYAEECYDDSISHEWVGSPKIPLPPVEIDPLGRKHVKYPSSISVPAVAVYYQEWTHEEPTLSGFIEWLRQRKELQ